MPPASLAVDNVVTAFRVATPVISPWEIASPILEYISRRVKDQLARISRTAALKLQAGLDGEWLVAWIKGVVVALRDPSQDTRKKTRWLVHRVVLDLVGTKECHQAETIACGALNELLDWHAQFDGIKA